METEARLVFPTTLHAKLQRPPVGSTAIARPRLMRQLDEGLARRVTLISAPAGFGKSTVASAWVEHFATSVNGGTAPPERAACWLSLDAEDNQLPAFVARLAAAIERSFPHSCNGVVALLEARPFPSVESVADMLVQSLQQFAASVVLVLDDLHFVQDAAIYAFIARLVEYAPSQLHLVLITRLDPPLPVNRWRALGWLSELRLRDLSFTSAETGEFLRRNLEHSLPSELVETLHRRTEGWAVGIWLALLALRNRTDYAEFNAQFETYTGRYTVDYLADEVIGHQPPSVQRFLEYSAILNRFSSGLCAAILEIDEQSAKAHIEHLRRANLFLIELTTPPYWYRYHHQFQDMLVSRLHMRYDSQTVAALHRKAAGWLIDQDYIADALDHLSAIPDEAAAGDVIEVRRSSALNELRFADLETWLGHISPKLLKQRPILLATMAWVQLDHVHKEGCLSTVRRLAKLMDEQSESLSGTTRLLLEAEIVALSTSLDDALDRNEALSLIRRSWSQLRPLVALTHCHVVLYLAYTSQRLGDLDLALTIVRTALEEAIDWPVMARCRVLHTLGFFHYCDGDLAQAELNFLENLRLGEEHGLPLITTISHHGLGAVTGARGQDNLAEGHHLEVIKRPHLTNGRDAVVDMYHLIGVYARRGEPEMSRSLVNRLKDDARIIGRSFFLDQVAALDAYVDLTCGDLASAMRWALSRSRTKTYDVADKIPVIRARILLADGAEASLLEAEELLQTLIALHEADHAWYRLSEALALETLVKARLGRKDAALETLARSVHISVPKGDLEPFLETSGEIVSLLRTLKQMPEHARLVRLLLAALSEKQVQSPRTPNIQDLPEPLSERELDVLKLLAERLSNKEIARALVVSPHTVRNHTSSIYGKLQAENRREAVERARSLGLLT